MRYPRPEILKQIPLDRDAVIEASAGTGKTYTLEHLIVEILLNGRDARGNRIPIDKILIVTYTDRATMELRERVRGILERIVSYEPDPTTPAADDVWEISPEDLKFLERQLFAFEKAPINTIHGFCRKVLSENAFHMRRLFDQSHADSKQLFEKAFKRALREHFARDPRYQPYLKAWLARQSVQKLSDDLAQVVSTQAHLAPKWVPGAFCDAMRAVAAKSGDWNRGAEFIARELGGDPEMTHDRVLQLVQICRRFAEFEDLSDALTDMDEHVTVLKGWLENGLPRGVIYELADSAAHLRVAVLQTFREPVKACLDDEKARGFFDFDDMLRMVWERLKDPTDPSTRQLVDLLRKQYLYALVDEFQDTDATQWDIFRILFFESPDNRLYVIGDPKQAIYGFRGADVNMYLNARQAITSRDIETVNLTRNYRSTPNLIAAYNQIFDQAAERPFFEGAIRYDNPVTAGQPNARATDAEGRDLVPIALVELQEDRLWAREAREMHGHFIGREIQKILREGWRVSDGEGGTRTVAPQDIYVLTRSRREEREIGGYLRQYQVPFSFFKLEGLYQTPEAHEVLALLRAIHEPHVEGLRLKAWGTAFFGLTLQELGECKDLPETDPLVDRLIYWHELSIAREFERLFTDILDRSGVIRRELFFKESERELTNFLHIFEQLVEETHGSNLTMTDLVTRLQKWVFAEEVPEGDDKNVQRLESERDTVQIMTMHKSKGLEADIVFLFGGLSGWKNEAFVDMHVHGRRVRHIGPPLHPAAKAGALREVRNENTRLLYVAVTRARARVYLPVIRKAKFEVDGAYQELNTRLLAMYGNVPAGLFETRVVTRNDVATRGDVTRASGVDFVLPQTPYDVFSDYPALRGRPLVVSSYSRLKAAKGGYKTAFDVEEFKVERSPKPDEWRQEIELPGGTGPGVFMHALLEEIPFSSVAQTPLESWESDPEILGEFVAAHQKFGIDAKYRPWAMRTIYDTLTAEVRLPEGAIRMADVTRQRREVEFVFPIPEAAHATLKQKLRGEFTIERGWIKGFIDLLFEVNGKVYFADWKTDTLHAYDEATLEAHVALNYELQAKLYSVAVARLYGLHDKRSFDRKFGGFVYFFLRGIDGAGRGLYVRRPSYKDVCAFERDMVQLQYG